jgi:hypothetical protein
VGLRGFFFICAAVGTGDTTTLVMVCGYGGVFFICYTAGAYCLISLVIIWRKGVFLSLFHVLLGQMAVTVVTVEK